MDRITIPLSRHNNQDVSLALSRGGAVRDFSNAELFPDVKFSVRATLRYSLHLASPVEQKPEFHIFGTHGMTATHIVRVPAGARSNESEILVDIPFSHKGPIPADAALHFHLFVQKINHDETEAAGRNMWVMQRVGVGYMFLSTIYPSPSKPKPIGMYLEQSTAREAKKGMVVLSYDPANIRMNGLSLEPESASRMKAYWAKHNPKRLLAADARRVIPIHAEPTPFDVTDDNAGAIVSAISDFITKTELDLYMDNMTPGSKAVLDTTVEKSKRVHMVQWVTPLGLITLAPMYALPPASWRMRSADDWRQQEPFYLNVMRIALGRANVSADDFVRYAKAQLASTKSTVFPETRLVELVLQEYVSAVATAVPYTEDSIYLRAADVTASFTRKMNEDFGDGYIRGTEDCEGLTRMMALTYFATKAPYETDILRTAGKFLDLYVPEFSLTMVDSSSLGRASKAQVDGRLGITTPLLKIDPRTESSRADGAAAHMCLILTPVTVHCARIARCNGRPFQVEVPDPDAFVQKHIRPFSDDLRVIQCEGTGHLLEELPATFFCKTEAEKRREMSRLDKRAAIHTDVMQNAQILLTLGKPTYVQNNYNAIKGPLDRDYTPHSVFYGWFQELFTPFWMQYDIPVMKLGILSMDGGPYRDGKPRLTVPSERMFLKDPAVGYYVYKPMPEAIVAMSLSVLEQEEPTPVETIVNLTWNQYDGTFSHEGGEGIAIVGRDGRCVQETGLFESDMFGHFDDGKTPQLSEEEKKKKAAKTARGVYESIVEKASKEVLGTLTVDLGNGLTATIRGLRENPRQAYTEETYQAATELKNVVDNGKIAVDGGVILSTDSPSFTRASHDSNIGVRNAYSSLSDSARRSRASMSYYFREGTVSNDVVVSIAKMVGKSSAIEGVEFVPEIFHVDRDGKPLNAIIRVTLYGYE